MRTRKQFLTLVAAGITTISLLAIFNAVNAKPATLEVGTSPLKAKVMVNGKGFPANEPSGIRYGSYEITVSAENFATQTKRINVDENNKQAEIVFMLDPINDAGRRLLGTQEEELHRESLGGQASVDNSQRFFDKFPFARKLPYEEATFTINYGFVNTDQEQSLTFTILGDMNAAKAWLTAQGVNVNDFKFEQDTNIDRYLPFENDQFKISRLANGAIQVSRFAAYNRPEQYETYIEQYKEYRQAALTWLAARGITPQNTSIVYIPLEEGI